VNTHIRTFRFALVAAIAALIVAVPVASAGKGKPGGGGGGTTSGGSITLVPLYSHLGEPAIGDQVTFSISTSAAYPSVRVDCYQGSLVYSQTRGFYASYPWGQTFQLGPTPSWAIGSASCKAVLFTTSGTKTVTLGSTSFSVSG
jgi:hypothetical protein